jgi:pyrroloquinoline-quinone synthase
LFLEYPRGLGMDLSRFENVTLLPAAQRFRNFLDAATEKQGWAVATAVTTLFLEGTAFERGEIDERAKKRPVSPLSEHPLVKHYGLPESHLALTRAHRAVEGQHRQAAWAVLDHVAEHDHRRVIEAMTNAVTLWRLYRDDVAQACGIVGSEEAGPTLAR